MGADAMNACTKTRALLFENAGGRTGPAVRAELEAHLAICPHCKQVLAAWTWATSQLRALPIGEPSAVSLRRMENEVLRQTQTAPPALPRRRLWLALAAGLILAGGAVALSLRTGTPQPFARIETLWGRVTLSGVAMNRGAAIGPGGVLEIAAEGEASFTVGRAADARLFGPGRVALEGTRRGPRLRLDSGRLAVQLAHRQASESFAVTTAHGRVEVRGTRFVVGYNAQGSYVHVDDGEVAAFRAGAAGPFAVKAGETFSLAILPSPEPAPELAPEPRQCPKSSCAEAGARVRKAMRVGNPGRALDLVEQALGQAADCPPEARCLDELGYLRAEPLQQAGRIEAAVAAYRSLNRPGATRAMRQNALYSQALLERRLGHAADARQSFERALAASPEGALAEESMAAWLELLDPASADARAVAGRYWKSFPHGVAATRSRRILSAAPGAR
jgi:ferric-dicitrate binding protein FerR (iron transport regulator)